MICMANVSRKLDICCLIQILAILVAITVIMNGIDYGLLATAVTSGVVFPQFKEALSEV